jgi:serine/threonine-protein kinase
MRPALVAGANEYRLLERVATTALGSVHRALHVSSGRVVEVRLMQRLADDPAGARAFGEALPAIASLRHRGILPVESWGDTDGVPSVVTPLPDAEPLADRLATAWLPDRASALRMLREIAAAVDHAHRLGVVHGDLEPATVLVGADGSALVAHFGLARLAGATPMPGGTSLRHGSPAHVAPERFPAGTLGPPADIYAFAVIAWQLLTGRLPLDGSPPAAAAAVLLRGLDRDPGARWATCGELVAALEAALAGAQPPVPAPPPPPEAPAQTGRLAGIPARTWLAAVCGLLLLGVLGAVIASGERPGGAATNRVVPAGGPTVGASPAPPPVTASEAPSPTPALTVTPAPATPTAAPVAPVPAATVRPAPTRTPTASPTPAGLSMSVSDPNPRPGEQNVIVTGHGFDPAQQYVIYFVQQDHGVQLLFGPASPRGNGDFSSPVRIPTGAQPGNAVIAGCVYVVNRGPTSRCAVVQLNVRG